AAGPDRGPQADGGHRGLVGAALDPGGPPVTAVPDAIPIRIPLAPGAARGGRPTGHYEAVIVVLEQDGLRGLGEAPVVTARGGSLASLVDELSSGTARTPAARCALETARCDLEA